MIRSPRPCLVVLVVPSGSGTSHRAETSFPAGKVLSCDRPQALAGTDEHHRRAGVRTAIVRRVDPTAVDRVPPVVEVFGAGP